MIVLKTELKFTLK